VKESVLCVFLSVREKAYVCVVYVCRVCMSVRERESVCVREGGNVYLLRWSVYLSECVCQCHCVLLCALECAQVLCAMSA